MRNVLRCQTCQLVQFQTLTGRCRKCNHRIFCGVQFVKLKPPQSVEPELIAAAEPTKPRKHRHLQMERIFIGPTVRALRQANGLNRRELAEHGEFPLTYISRIEWNRLCPGPVIIARLAKALGVPFLWMLEDAVDAEILFRFSELPVANQAAVIESLAVQVAA